MEWWQILISSIAFIIAIVIATESIIITCKIYFATGNKTKNEKFLNENREKLKEIIEKEDGKQEGINEKAFISNEDIKKIYKK